MKGTMTYPISLTLINPNFNLFLILKSTFIFVATSLTSGPCHRFNTDQPCHVTVQLTAFTKT